MQEKLTEEQRVALVNARLDKLCGIPPGDAEPDPAELRDLFDEDDERLPSGDRLVLPAPKT